jgi:hypothetical protein
MSSLNWEFHTTTHLSSIVIIKGSKKKNKQIKKVAVAFFLFKAKQKGNLFFSFWAKPKKNKQIKIVAVVVFFVLGEIKK